jgi:hypothetical protein
MAWDNLKGLGLSELAQLDDEISLIPSEAEYQHRGSKSSVTVTDRPH